MSASLLCSPNFRDPQDNARRQLITITEKVVIYDPEFVLKVSHKGALEQLQIQILDKTEYDQKEGSASTVRSQCGNKSVTAMSLCVSSLTLLSKKMLYL